MEVLSNLGIDLSYILFYLVNMGVLFALLSKFVFPKILHYLDERRNQIQKNLTEADALKVEMEKQQKLMEKERKEMRDQFQLEASEAKRSLEKQKKELEAEIEAKKAKMLEEVQKVIAEQKDQMIHSVKTEMLHTVQRMITYIVSNKLPKEVIQESVESAWDKIKLS